MSRTLRKQARRLARKGRFGDKHLLHVNEEELQSLKRTGKVHTNPETGLPEAFSIGGISFSDVRNFAEASLGGSAIGGPVGSVAGGANDIMNPGGATDTVLRDVGGGVAAAAGIVLGGEAAGMPMWGSSGAAAGADAGAAPFYGDLATESAGDVGAGAGTGAGAAADDQLYADSWAANASRAAPAVGSAGMSVPNMFMLGMGGLSAVSGAAGLYNAYEGRQYQKKQQQQQQSYYDQLQSLMSNPGQVTSLPGYEFNLEQGQQALQRKMASMGYGTSGNLAEAMTRFGSDYSTSVLGNQEQLLASQYGRASPPTSTMPDPTTLAMNSLSNMGYGFAPFMFSQGQG